MLTDWDNTGQGFRGLAHAVRPNLSSQWNGNTIYRSTRGLISKRTTRVGANVSLRGWLNSTLSDQSDHVLPRAAMHTIADAGTLIPTAQKPPCAIESRPRKGVTESDQEAT
jgi:hypothetical protein